MKLLHRYHSTLHGNYRRAYLRCGALCGLLMGAYVLLRWLIGQPEAVPTSFAASGILAVLVFVCGVAYRRSLPDKLVSFKEMMLFGLGMSAVAAVVYGLMLWLTGLAFPAQATLFTNRMTGQPSDYPPRYWAAWWGMLAAVEMAVLGVLVAFLAAVFLRTEKAPALDTLKSENK